MARARVLSDLDTIDPSSSQSTTTTPHHDPNHSLFPIPKRPSTSRTPHSTQHHSETMMASAAATTSVIASMYRGTPNHSSQMNTRNIGNEYTVNHHDSNTPYNNPAMLKSPILSPTIGGGGRRSSSGSWIDDRPALVSPCRLPIQNIPLIPVLPSPTPPPCSNSQQVHTQQSHENSSHGTTGMDGTNSPRTPKRRHLFRNHGRNTKPNIHSPTRSSLPMNDNVLTDSSNTTTSSTSTPVRSNRRNTVDDDDGTTKPAQAPHHLMIPPPDVFITAAEVANVMVDISQGIRNRKNIDSSTVPNGSIVVGNANRASGGGDAPQSQKENNVMKVSHVRYGHVENDTATTVLDPDKENQVPGNHSHVLKSRVRFESDLARPVLAEKKDNVPTSPTKTPPSKNNHSLDVSHTLAPSCQSIKSSSNDGTTMTSWEDLQELEQAAVSQAASILCGLKHVDIALEAAKSLSRYLVPKENWKDDDYGIPADEDTPSTNDATSNRLYQYQKVYDAAMGLNSTNSPPSSFTNGSGSSGGIQSSSPLAMTYPNRPISSGQDSSHSSTRSLSKKKKQLEQEGEQRVYNPVIPLNQSHCSSWKMVGRHPFDPNIPVHIFSSTSCALLPHPNRLSMPNDAHELNSLHCYVRSELLELFVVGHKDPSSSSKVGSTNKSIQHDSDISSDEQESSGDEFTESSRRNRSSCRMATRRDPKPSSLMNANRMSDRLFPGRVGLRCKYCAHIPRSRQCNGSGGEQSLKKATMSSFYPKSLGDLYRSVCTWQRVHFRACCHIPQNVKDHYWSLKDGDRTRGKTRYWVTSAMEMGLVDDDGHGKGGVRFLKEDELITVSTNR